MVRTDLFVLQLGPVALDMVGGVHCHQSHLDLFDILLCRIEAQFGRTEC